MRRRGGIGKKIVCCLISALLLSESVPEAVRAADGVFWQDGLDYVLGRPMTEEEEAAQRQLMGEHTFRLRPFDPGSAAPSVKEDGEPRVRSAGLPTAYDARTENIITPVKNQSPYGICWSFTSILMAEANMVKKGLSALGDIDLSEYHLAYYTYRFVEDPLGGTGGDNNYKGDMDGILNEGGNLGRAKHTLTAWMGAAPEAVAPFSGAPAQLPDTQEGAYGNNAGLLKKVIEINVKTDRDEAKQALMEYGALGFMYYSDNSAAYYNTDTAAQYIDDAGKGQNHAVAVIGWDDTFSKENFGEAKPSEDGAWLVRNSWGTGYGDQGYFWLSYEDATIWDTVYAFEMTDVSAYDNNYQYDGSSAEVMVVAGNVFELANVFTAKANPGKYEVLEAVSFDMESVNVDYEIQIYKNPTVESNPTSGTPMINPQKGSTAHAGYYTVDLDEQVWLSQGDKFAVVVKFTKDGSSIKMVFEDASGVSTAEIKKGESFFNLGDWTDIVDYAEAYPGLKYYNPRIKAFTVNKDVLPSINVTGISMPEKEGLAKVGETKQIEASAEPENATNKVINWSSSDESVALVDSAGMVTGQKQGSAVITATTADGSFSAGYRLTVEADPVITAAAVSQVSGTAAVVTVEANDGGRPIRAYRLAKTAGEGNPAIGTGSEANVFLLSGLRPVTDYTFTATVEDSGGNTAWKAVSFTTPKAEAPAAPVMKGGYTASLADDTTYTYTIEPIEGAEYRMDMGQWQDSNVFDGIAQDSSHTFMARIRETADTEVGKTGTTGLIYFPAMKGPDTEAPAIKVTRGYGGSISSGWYTTPQSLKISVEDSDSGIASVSWQMDNGAAIPLFQKGPDPVPKWDNAAALLEAEEGEHSYAILAEDAKGNKASLLVSIRLDTTAPVLSEVSAPTGDALGGDFANITFKANDDGSFYYKLQTEGNAPTVGALLTEAANPMAAEGDNKISLGGLEPDRQYTLYIAAQDKAGNRTAKVASVAFRTAQKASAPTEDPGGWTDKEGITSIFHDVKEGNWFVDAVEYVYSNNIMMGIGNNLFDPNGMTTRAMVVKILHNTEGMPTSPESNPFTDVPAGKWYELPVRWALGHGITTGTSPTEFDPDRSVTRQEVASFLYRYAIYKGYDISHQADLSGYPDEKAISAYAKQPMAWANAVGIVTGKGGVVLDPQGTATRAEIAAMVQRFEAYYQ